MVKGRGGIMGLIATLGIGAVVFGGLLSIAKMNNINSVDDLYNYSRRQSQNIKACYENKGEGCITVPKIDTSSVTHVQDEFKLTDKDLDYSGPKKGVAYIQDEIKLKKTYLLATVNKLKTGKINKTKFNEKEWARWLPLDNHPQCWNTKKEILSQQAIPDSLTFVDVNHEKTKDKNKACAIIKGKWTDPYTGEEVTDINEMDVDYVIPLEIVNNLNGSSWADDLKQKYANDTSGLIAVKKESKDKRDGKDIDEFKIKNKNYKCTFAKNYTYTISKYGIQPTEKAKDELVSILSSCDK